MAMRPPDLLPCLDCGRSVYKKWHFCPYCGLPTTCHQFTTESGMRLLYDPDDPFLICRPDEKSGRSVDKGQEQRPGGPEKEK